MKPSNFTAKEKLPYLLNLKKGDYMSITNEDFAKRDGFKSAEEMFNYFNKNYDLSSPKEFWVYRGIKQ